jgi:uncharacterized protein YmfQ (DUF2313 family)
VASIVSLSIGIVALGETGTRQSALPGLVVDESRPLSISATWNADGQANTGWTGSAIAISAWFSDGQAAIAWAAVGIAISAWHADGQAAIQWMTVQNTRASWDADGVANAAWSGKKRVVPTGQPKTTVGDRHVRRSGSNYAQAFLDLLPHGQAWTRDLGSVLVRTCAGLADYWGYVDSRAADLLETESDPRATVELLPDWERAWGLPDPCVTDPPTALFERRANLVAKMTLLGAQSRAFFYSVAEKLGYTIQITELSPYMCGVSRCGDTRGQFNPDDQSHYYWTLGPPENRFYWTVHVGALKVTYFHVNSSQCGIDRLMAFEAATDLECYFDRWKPAHTDIVYDYSPQEALDFSQPFDTQYLPLGIM